MQMIGIDLFSGVGGMSLGFERAGFDIRAAVDLDPINVKIHRLNFPSCVTICGDIRSLTGDELRARSNLVSAEITVVFGGPPCQGFSRGGKHLGGDERNTLIEEFIRLVGEIGPSYFVMENVDGLLSVKHSGIVNRFITSANNAGYLVVEPIRVLNASDFGVPQKRRRAFILGYRYGKTPPEYPCTFPSSNIDNALSDSPVWAAISDLATIDANEEYLVADQYSGPLGEASHYVRLLRGDVRWNDTGSRSSSPVLTGCQSTKHSPDTVARFTEVTPGSREPISRFWRLDKSGLSPTLRAGTGSDRGSFTAPRPIHPVYPRCIRVREAARLHSFPDWFLFHHTKWHGFRQIGNAVPPHLASAIADSIRQALSFEGSSRPAQTSEGEDYSV